MHRYRNLSGNSGVDAYETGGNSITVRFTDGSAYLYDCRSSGRTHVEEMMRLAAREKGLATYINQHVREKFARKIR